MSTKFQKIIAWPVCLIFILTVTLSGISYVLCISDDGHSEIEAFCYPNCAETNEVAEIDGVNDLNNHHNDCFSCTDIKIDNPFWSKRRQNTDSNQITNFTLALIPDAIFDLNPTQNNNLQINNFYLSGNQGPPSYYIAATVLRC